MPKSNFPLREIFEEILLESMPIGCDSGDSTVAYLAKKGLAELAKFPFVVFPGSEKFDLGDKKPVALCQSESQARAIIDKMWPGIGYFEQIS